MWSSTSAHVTVPGSHTIATVVDVVDVLLVVEEVVVDVEVGAPRHWFWRPIAHDGA